MEYNFRALINLLREKSDQIDETVEGKIESLWQWGVERISDQDIRQAIKHYYFAGVPVAFFSAPASVSGGKHPSWHNEPGGIVWHLMECCKSANRLLQAYGYTDDEERFDLRARDIVLAATLITDTLKNGCPWGEKTLKNHGELAALRWKYLSHGFVDDDALEQIAYAAHYHYGRYTPVPNGHEKIRFKDLPPLAQIVHLLDMCSSNNDYGLIYRPVERIAPPESIRP
ncbi:MAG: hypothetical protein WAP23_01720 [Candidatus Spechtbacterales bacterium]